MRLAHDTAAMGMTSQIAGSWGGHFQRTAVQPDLKGNLRWKAALCMSAGALSVPIISFRHPSVFWHWPMMPSCGMPCPACGSRGDGYS